MVVAIAALVVMTLVLVVVIVGAIVALVIVVVMMVEVEVVATEVASFGPAYTWLGLGIWFSDGVGGVGDGGETITQPFGPTYTYGLRLGRASG